MAEYSRYAEKHQIRNQSINQSELAQILSQIWMRTSPRWMDHCAFLSVGDVITANEGLLRVFTVTLVKACHINTEPWSAVLAWYDSWDLGPYAFVVKVENKNTYYAHSMLTTIKDYSCHEVKKNFKWEVAPVWDPPLFS